MGPKLSIGNGDDRSGGDSKPKIRDHGNKFSRDAEAKCEISFWKKWWAGMIFRDGRVFWKCQPTIARDGESCLIQRNHIHVAVPH